MDKGAITFGSSGLVLCSIEKPQLSCFSSPKSTKQLRCQHACFSTLFPGSHIVKNLYRVATNGWLLYFCYNEDIFLCTFSSFCHINYWYDDFVFVVELVCLYLLFFLTSLKTDIDEAKRHESLCKFNNNLYFLIILYQLL